MSLRCRKSNNRTVSTKYKALRLAVKLTAKRFFFVINDDFFTNACFALTFFRNALTSVANNDFSNTNMLAFQMTISDTLL